MVALMSIPNVLFSHRQSQNSEIEIFELASLAQRINLDPNPQHPHRINFFMLILIEQGTGHHMVDFVKHSFAPGSLIFIQREQVHCFDFSNHPEGKVLVFTQAFLDQVHSNMHLPNYTPTHLNSHHSPLFTLEDNSYGRVVTLIKEIMTEQLDQQREPLIVMYLFSALALLLRKQNQRSHTSTLSQEQSKKLSQFFSLLQDNYRQIRDATWYANQMNTTYKTLNQVCKSAAGLTAKQMVDAFVILEIKRQLVIRKVSSQQIAYEFGFDDASNFVKYFKNMESLTPSQFQQKHRY
jgi:AraC family transcriptional regulator, transcriptional activator of pobA